MINNAELKEYEEALLWALKEYNEFPPDTEADKVLLAQAVAGVRLVAEIRRLQDRGRQKSMEHRKSLDDLAWNEGVIRALRREVVRSGDSAARLEAEVRQLKEELKGMIDLAREYGLGSHEPTPQVAARLGYPDEWAP